MNKPTSALLTRMDQPLGTAVGNALEVKEVISCLRGEGPADLMDVTYALVGEMLDLGGLADSYSSARDQLESCIRDGSALQSFRELIQAQGGDPEVVDCPERLPEAGQVKTLDYSHNKPAFVADVDALLVGEAARLLGAGRLNLQSEIDPAVGVVLCKKIGDRVEPGEPLAEIHFNDQSGYALAHEKLNAAFEFSAKPVLVPPVLINKLSS